MVNKKITLLLLSIHIQSLNCNFLLLSIKARKFMHVLGMLQHTQC